MGVSIADVAGKGLPAALVMANVQASIRACVGLHAAPQSVAADVNHSLCRNVNLSTFVTFFDGVIDCAAQTVTFTNAGHNPPMLVHADGSVDRLATGGLVLGLFEDTPFEHGEVARRSGDRLVLFTDGVTEAERADGTEFGDAGLLQTIRDRRHKNAREVIEGVMAAVREFTGGSFRDDATLVCVALDDRTC